jgi:hypothetical protein
MFRCLILIAMVFFLVTGCHSTEPTLAKAKEESLQDPGNEYHHVTQTLETSDLASSLIEEGWEPSDGQPGRGIHKHWMAHRLTRENRALTATDAFSNSNAWATEFSRRWMQGQKFPASINATEVEQGVRAMLLDTSRWNFSDGHFRIRTAFRDEPEVSGVDYFCIAWSDLKPWFSPIGSRIANSVKQEKCSNSEAILTQLGMVSPEKSWGPEEHDPRRSKGQVLGKLFDR